MAWLLSHWMMIHKVILSNKFEAQSQAKFLISAIEHMFSSLSKFWTICNESGTAQMVGNFVVPVFWHT